MNASKENRTGPQSIQHAGWKRRLTNGSRVNEIREAVTAVRAMENVSRPGPNRVDCRFWSFRLNREAARYFPRRIVEKLKDGESTGDNIRDFPEIA